MRRFAARPAIASRSEVDWKSDHPLQAAQFLPRRPIAQGLLCIPVEVTARTNHRTSVPNRERTAGVCRAMPRTRIEAAPC